MTMDQLRPYVLRSIIRLHQTSHASARAPCVDAARQAPPPLRAEWRPEKESKDANPLGADDVRQAFAAFGGVRSVDMAEERSANGRRAHGVAASGTWGCSL